jgi:hypothetical protein
MLGFIFTFLDLFYAHGQGRQIPSPKFLGG